MKHHLSGQYRTIQPGKISMLPVLALILLTIAGCAYPISQEIRGEIRPDLTFPMVFGNSDAYIGSIVIWGGSIIETLNHGEETEIIVLETPLGYEEKPEGQEYSQGRFIVKIQKFLDPAIYRAGRWITVGGEIMGKETKPLGGTSYTYPVIRSKQLYLWQRPRVYAYPPDYYWWGWYGPYGPYWPYDRDDWWWY